MTQRIDGQYQLLTYDIRDKQLADAVESLEEAHDTPDKLRQFINMAVAAASLDGDVFTLNDNEAKKLLEAWKAWDGQRITASKPIIRALQSAYVAGRRNCFFNVTATLQKYGSEFPVPLRVRIYKQKNVKVYYRVFAEGFPNKDLGIVEGTTDAYGVARANFQPSAHGRYIVYASTDKKDVEGDVINHASKNLAVGSVAIVPDKPVVAIDIVGLIDRHGLKGAKEFLTKNHDSRKYHIIGITPYNDLHAQNRLESLVKENDLSFVQIVHNSYRISDYYDSEIGRQEYLGEYVKRMVSQYGLPVVAGIGFGEYVGNGFRIADPGGSLIDVFVSSDVNWQRRMPHIDTGKGLSEIADALLDPERINGYQQKVASLVAKRDSDDYKERASWQISRLTGATYSDGNSIEHIRDMSAKRDDNRATFYTWLEKLKSVPPGGKIVGQQFAWNSSEEGLMVAMAVSDSAYRSKRFWDSNLRKRFNIIIGHAEVAGRTALASKLKRLRDRLAYLANRDPDPEYGKLVEKYTALMKRMDKLPDQPLKKVRAQFKKQREYLFFQLKKKVESQYYMGPVIDIRTVAENEIRKLESEVAGEVAGSSIASQLKGLIKYVEKTSRVPIYLLPDKTVLVEYPEAGGYNNGKFSMAMMIMSGAYVTVTNMDFGVRDKDGAIDPSYQRHNPLGRVAVTKHSKTFVLEVVENGKREWIALGGARLPTSKSMGRTNFRRKDSLNAIQKLSGVPTRSFEDESFILKGPAVADIYRYTIEDIKRMRPVAEISDSLKLVFPKESPPTDVKPGKDRIWALRRWPFEGSSAFDPIWYMLEKNSPEARELDIICGFDIDKKWMAHIEQMLAAGSVGGGETPRKKINYYTSANDFFTDSIDGKKAKMLAKLAIKARLARQKAGGQLGYEDQLNLYIVKALQFDPKTGRRLAPEKADSVQLHSRYYLLRGGDKKNWVGVTGGVNLDEQSLKDHENSEVVMGPDLEQLKWRTDEFTERSIYLNAVPGIVKPDANGNYWSEKKIEKFIWKHFSMKSKGNDLMAPTSLSFWDALTNIIGTFVGLIWDRIEKNDSYGMRVDYTPTLVDEHGFNKYHAWSAAYIQSKYLYGINAGLYLGVAGIGKDFVGVNAGLEVDGLIADPWGERKTVDPRFLGLDLGLGLLFSTKNGKPIGFFDLKVSPVNLAFHANQGRTEIIWKPVQLGLRTHWGYRPSNIPETGFLLGTTLTFSSKPNVPRIRNRELTEPRDVE